jgi:hypothetical protein
LELGLLLILQAYSLGEEAKASACLNHKLNLLSTIASPPLVLLCTLPKHGKKPLQLLP